jgi:hypothetical protein
MMSAQLVSSQQLRIALNDYFNADELVELCFTLGLDYENLSGEAKAEKVMELIKYCERRGRTDDLINTIQRARPHIDWEKIDQAIQSQRGPAQKVAERPYQQANIPNIPDYTNLGGNISQSAENAGLQTPADDESDETADSTTTTSEPSNPFQTITAPNRIFLAGRHGTRIYGFQTATPWNLPVDAFVLPLGYGPPYDPGYTAHALTTALEGTGAMNLADAFLKTVQTYSVLTPDKPFFLQGETPSDFWTLPGTNRRLIAATANDGTQFSADNAATAARAIVQLALNNQCQRITIPPLGSGTGGLEETAVALKMLDAVLAAIPTGDPDNPGLTEITLTGSAAVLTALRQRFLRRPQAAVNDEPLGGDLLQVETAVYALAEMCMLKDLEPPLAVGVLGGWGSGKSFVMHLMQERVAQLRRLYAPNPNSPQAQQFPYIGHVYQIKFDAWTYAKSNLWASLMQTIFYELNSQLTREREIAKKLTGIQTDETEESQQKIIQKLREDNPLWQLTTYPEMRTRNVNELILYAPQLEKVLKGKTVNDLREEAEKWLRGQDRASVTSATDIKQDHLWDELRKLKKDEREQLRQKEKELAEAQQTLEQARIKANQEVSQEIEVESKKLAWASIQNLVRQQFGLAYKHIERQFTKEEMGKNWLRTLWDGIKSLVFMILNNPLEFALFLLFAVLLVALEQSVAFLNQMQLPEWALPAGAVVAGWARSYSKWTDLIQKSFMAYQQQLEGQRYRLQATRQERFEKLMAQQKAIYTTKLQISQAVPGELTDATLVPAMEDRVTKLEAEAKFLRQRVGMTAGFVSLLDFVSSRLDDAVYEKELGLMHQVQRDLQELSDSLTADKTIEDLFPRGKPRIILYIDDLDRCPPLRVVEVLEAVQLLLKTDLFIVVLAIDVRFITRALETVYKGILTRRGSPSGLDYIEKIIQIPYRVQPIEETAVAGYLGKQVVVAAAAPANEPHPTDKAAADGRGTSGDDRQPDSEKRDGGDDAGDSGEEGDADDGRERESDLPVQAIEISSDEYVRMQNCCKQVAMTPRAIKRLANVYKLLKIIWYRNGSEPESLEMVEVIMAMLTLSERFPNQMRDLFADLSHQIRTGVETEIATYISSQQPEDEKDTYTAQEWKQLMADTAVLMPLLPMNKIDLKTFNLVRSFCFVGDIGYDPGELVQAAARQLANAANPLVEPAARSSEKPAEG